VVDSQVNRIGTAQAELLAIPLVEFVPVAMALTHDRLAVGLGHLRARRQYCVVGTQAHCAALVLDATLLEHLVDHWVVRGWIELCGVGISETNHVASELDRHRLQAETEPKTWDALFACIPSSSDLAFDSAGSEPTRDHDTIEVVQLASSKQTLDALGLDPDDLDIGWKMVFSKNW